MCYIHISKSKGDFKMKIKTEKQEREFNLKCENCKKEYTVELSELTLISVCQSYKLYSCECPFCGKKDYVRDSEF